MITCCTLWFKIFMQNPTLIKAWFAVVGFLPLWDFSFFLRQTLLSPDNRMQATMQAANPTNPGNKSDKFGGEGVIW